MKYRHRQFDPQVAARLAREIHPVLARVYAARGVTDASQLETSAAALPRPSACPRLMAAADVVVAAIQAHRPIVIIGDFDADGATAAAVLHRGLGAYGADVEVVIPDRFAHGYGLTAALVASLTAPPGACLITVDTGISALETIDLARGRGYQVVVTDHHLPGEYLPAADAIINPQLPDAAIPPNLAGCGVAFYLLAAVRGLIEDATLPSAATWLDLVAVGTVADRVVMDQSNRILVEQGLRRLRAGVGAAGVVALFEIAKRDVRQASVNDIGFAIAPRLNAAGRLSDMRDAIALLLTDDHAQAARLAATLEQLNDDRRTRQTEQSAWAKAACADQPGPVLVAFDERFDQGLTGLIAGDVARAMGRPAMVIAPAGEQELRGSIRVPSDGDLHAREFLARCAKQAGCLQRFGGHPRAAGFSLDRSALSILQQVVATAVHGDTEIGKAWCDGTIPAADLDLALGEALEGAGPWGDGFEAPLFVQPFELLDGREVGRGHLKLKLRCVAAGEVLTAIFFNAGERVSQALPASATLAYQPMVNRFRGQSTIELRIIDWLDN